MAAVCFDVAGVPAKHGRNQRAGDSRHPADAPMQRYSNIFCQKDIHKGEG